MITSLDRTHAGFYRCIVRNRMGALLQRQTEVQVACEYTTRTWGGWGEAVKRERICRVVPHRPHAGQSQVPAVASHAHWVLMVALPATWEPRPRGAARALKATPLTRDTHLLALSPALWMRPAASALKGRPCHLLQGTPLGSAANLGDLRNGRLPGALP